MRMRTASNGVIAKQVKTVAIAPASSTSGTRAPSTSSAPAASKRARLKYS